MNEVSQKIIDLCSDLFGETKTQVKKNNKSVDKLIKIFENLKETPEYAENIYSDLLTHSDDRVRFEAASCCMKLGCNVKDAENTLKTISQQNPNPIIRFSAEMVLEIWKENKSI